MAKYEVRFYDNPNTDAPLVVEGDFLHDGSYDMEVWSNPTDPRDDGKVLLAVPRTNVYYIRRIEE